MWPSQIFDGSKPSEKQWTGLPSSRRGSNMYIRLFHWGRHQRGFQCPPDCRVHSHTLCSLVSAVGSGMWSCSMAELWIAAATTNHWEPKQMGHLQAPTSGQQPCEEGLQESVGGRRHHWQYARDGINAETGTGVVSSIGMKLNFSWFSVMYLCISGVHVWRPLCRSREDWRSNQTGVWAVSGILQLIEGHRGLLVILQSYCWLNNRKHIIDPWLPCEQIRINLMNIIAE